MSKFDARKLLSTRDAEDKVKNYLEQRVGIVNTEDDEAFLVDRAVIQIVDGADKEKRLYMRVKARFYQPIETTAYANGDPARTFIPNADCVFIVDPSRKETPEDPFAPLVIRPPREYFMAHTLLAHLKYNAANLTSSTKRTRERTADDGYGSDLDCRGCR